MYTNEILYFEFIEQSEIYKDLANVLNFENPVLNEYIPGHPVCIGTKLYTANKKEFYFILLKCIGKV